MDKKNRLGALGNALFDLALIDVQRVRADIHEDGSGAAKDEGICGGGKRKIREDADAWIKPTLRRSSLTNSHIPAACGLRE
jgi:hypothetical protein